ncbi:hypothetical protein Pryu01_03035 [Paraliobacillus ryukyuensis]|uniref:Uncharacterized protein n=1 Tax=Paraliobacillus ryukyuensis TaxID=200904 RepID=A0A366DQ99_9BACI|nr:hypothetical protein [Paraliobacillus ryukyuensis]RBO92266.1 hypothetical protein DES48_1154 [Paraliobacillus ryukyuensis]
MEELKGIISTWKTILSEGNYPDIMPEELVMIEQLIDRVEYLENKNQDLNKEIGLYAGKFGELAHSIGVNIADMKILATRMCKPEGLDE